MDNKFSFDQVGDQVRANRDIPVSTVGRDSFVPERAWGKLVELTGRTGQCLVDFGGYGTWWVWREHVYNVTRLQMPANASATDDEPDDPIDALKREFCDYCVEQAEKQQGHLNYIEWLEDKLIKQREYTKQIIEASGDPHSDEIDQLRAAHRQLRDTLSMVVRDMTKLIERGNYDATASYPIAAALEGIQETAVRGLDIDSMTKSALMRVSDFDSKW